MKRTECAQVDGRLEDAFVSVSFHLMWVVDWLRSVAAAEQGRERKWFFRAGARGVGRVINWCHREHRREDCSIRVESVVHHWANQGVKKEREFAQYRCVCSTRWCQPCEVEMSSNRISYRERKKEKESRVSYRTLKGREKGEKKWKSRNERRYQGMVDIGSVR